MIWREGGGVGEVLFAENFQNSILSLKLYVPVRTVCSELRGRTDSYETRWKT